tara:strand:+ start:81 stop:629 length:549 start_codon:yes stop_codon:yes gene_type:complete
MINQISIKSDVSQKLFEKFLLKLELKTLNEFSNFGSINKKNVAVIAENELRKENRIQFFSIINNEIIAYSFLEKFEKQSKKHNCILGIVVADAWQQKGWGKKICKHMINSAWEKDMEKIWLTVYSDNIHAYSMYKKIGFKIEGIFMYDEKFHGKFKHKISMAIFKKHVNNKSKREKIIKDLN